MAKRDMTELQFTAALERNGLKRHQVMLGVQYYRKEPDSGERIPAQGNRRQQLAYLLNEKNWPAYRMAQRGQ